MAIEARRLSDALGAEIVGIDPAGDIDDATMAAIRAAWLDSNVLLFREVSWTPAQHVAFTRRFGPLHVMPRLGTARSTNLPDHPEVFVVSNLVRDGKPLGLPRAGWGWHTDGEDKQVPNMGSMLYAVIVPPEGGDTAFANMYRAYEALPERLRKPIEGRRGRFSRAEMHLVNYPHLPPLTEEEQRERPDVWHPLVRIHPETGRKSLYIGRWAVDVEGMPPDEGRALIDELRAFAVQPEFVYRHRWRVGDVVLWDNRCTQHSAIPFDDTKHERHMLRTTLEGDIPAYGALQSEVAAAA